MLFKTEFPDFDSELPTIAGFEDTSWHNDTCPCLQDEARKLILWCDYADLTKREYEGGKRYTLIQGDYGVPDEDQVTLCESDDIAEILAAIPA